MNAEQVKSAVRWFIATFGASIVNHGWASSSTLETIGGLIVTLAPFVWAMFTHTQTNAVAVVDAIAKQPDSPVKAVVTEPNEAGQKLADSLPGNTTVVAGSAAASTAAKAVV